MIGAGIAGRRQMGMFVVKWCIEMHLCSGSGRYDDSPLQWKRVFILWAVGFRSLWAPLRRQ